MVEELNKLNFKISSSLKNIIGKELITDDYIAVFELVKNAYDAHAQRVEIEFIDIYSENAKIIIRDDGKGMNYDDIINKWLFVAYSAKKEGEEDNEINYRDRIYTKRAFAGAKGIGRFSCDRLGEKLKIITTKREYNAKTEILLIDWNDFEVNSKKEFIDIEVEHFTEPNNPKESDFGTVLEISNIRKESNWNREKLLKLKDSLAKLISPNKSNQKFNILLKSNDELEGDRKETEYRKIINGYIKNVIFDLLDIKTTKIIANVSKDKKVISIELYDGGKFIYKIEEKNIYPLLESISIKIYYLNKKAKLNFGRKMGLSVRYYGSIFVYRNGFRVHPFGEPEDDSFKLEIRKTKRRGSYLGTRDIIGEINIKDENELFKEISSRDGGFIVNDAYRQLEDFLIEKVVIRLEKYVIEVQKWGLSLDDIEIDEEDEKKLKNRIVSLISKLTDSDDIINFDYDENLIEILSEIQKNNESASSLVSNLKRIASNTNNSTLLESSRKLEKHIKDLKSDIADADKELRRAKNIIQKQTTENLFLKSIRSNDLTEIVNLMHQVGISANTIDNYLIGLTYKINNNIPISNEVLKKAIEIISFENKKILSISRFATKAKFNLRTEVVNLDLAIFIVEYIENVAKKFKSQSIKIKLIDERTDEFKLEFRPIEIIILLDNMIDNAKKANSKKIDITVKTSENELLLKFRDNGMGIKKEITDFIFDYGFTTTDGSGLGLNHVKEILNKFGGEIKVNEKIKTGTEFIININKSNGKI